LRVGNTLDLRKEFYSPKLRELLCYPRPIESDFEAKVAELTKAGVDSIVFEGPTKVLDGVSILGKGSVGLVFLCKLGTRYGAIKVLRADGNRESLEHEARCIAKANSVGVGPVLFSYGRTYILMERVSGVGIFDFFRTLRRGRVETLKQILSSVLNQARDLDRIGLEHGQLSNPSKHIVVDPLQDNLVKIIDFETSRILPQDSKDSVAPTGRNVSQVAQALFIRSKYSRKVFRMLRVRSALPDRRYSRRRVERQTSVEVNPILIGYLKAYRRSPSNQNFEELKAFLNLQR
jgi:putative serine/threonine protein kinase